jgi:hypothetical protein
MTEESYEQLDDLFREIKLGLVKIRRSDPETVDDLKSLIAQLELWVESLVADSLKLKSLEGLLQKTTELAKRLRKGLEKGERNPEDRGARGTSPTATEDVSRTTGQP